jgi:hypothetical protein
LSVSPHLSWKEVDRPRRPEDVLQLVIDLGALTEEQAEEQPRIPRAEVDPNQLHPAPPQPEDRSENRMSLPLSAERPRVRHSAGTPMVPASQHDEPIERPNSQQPVDSLAGQGRLPVVLAGVPWRWNTEPFTFHHDLIAVA